MSKMTLTTDGDRHVVVTRRFAAPPEMLFRAHTEPALLQQWLLGPEGWAIRYEWSDGNSNRFSLTGE